MKARLPNLFLMSGIKFGIKMNLELKYIQYENLKKNLKLSSYAFNYIFNESSRVQY